MPIAFITGVTGQDGSYLTEFLLSKGYIVHGMMRTSSSFTSGRIEHLLEDAKILNQTFFLHYGNMNDGTRLSQLIQQIQPDEVYNLAAQSHVQRSFLQPMETGSVGAQGTLALLEAIRTAGLTHKTKFYQASTSELYGLVQEVPQREETPFYPRSPYAVAKLYAFWIVKNYREAYGIFACNGILFNHESPRRGETFVTRKITRAVAAIAQKKEECVILGNIDAKRDWGHAKDYVEAMWLILQQPQPEDFVVASGETHSVREFIQGAFACIGKTISWHGAGLDEQGIDQDGIVRVKISARYFRPTEVDLLLGDATKLKARGWKPRGTLSELIAEMVAADMRIET